MNECLDYNGAWLYTVISSAYRTSCLHLYMDE